MSNDREKELEYALNTEICRHGTKSIYSIKNASTTVEY